MNKPKVFRCYRCGELRNGKPVFTLELNGDELRLCRHCQDEAAGELQGDTKQFVTMTTKEDRSS